MERLTTNIGLTAAEIKAVKKLVLRGKLLPDNFAAIPDNEEFCSLMREEITDNGEYHIYIHTSSLYRLVII